MKTQNILRTSYLDLLFENRNKEYGSYILRRYANRTGLLSLTVVMALLVIGLLLGIVVKLSPAAQPRIITDVNHGPIIMTPLEMPQPAQNIPLQEPVQKAPAIAPAEKFVVPVITDDPVIPPDDVLKDVSTFKDKLTGPVTYEGIEDGTETARSKERPEAGGGGMIKTVEDKGNAVDPKKVYHTVSAMPEFPGGQEALRAYLQSKLRYPEAAIDAGIGGMVLVEFVVNEQGSIEQEVVIKGIGGGCDREALRVVKAMPRWTPGKVGDRPVKVLYKLPLTFNLQHQIR